MTSTNRIPHPDAPQGIQPPPAHDSLPRFGLIVVGDEILSGRRSDSHIPKTIELLGARGLALAYVHIVGDDRAQLIGPCPPLFGIRAHGDRTAGGVAGSGG